MHAASLFGAGEREPVAAPAQRLDRLDEFLWIQLAAQASHQRSPGSGSQASAVNLASIDARIPETSAAGRWKLSVEKT